MVSANGLGRKSTTGRSVNSVGFIGWPVLVVRMTGVGCVGYSSRSQASTPSPPPPPPPARLKPGWRPLRRVSDAERRVSHVRTRGLQNRPESQLKIRLPCESEGDSSGHRVGERFPAPQAKETAPARGRNRRRPSSGGGAASATARRQRRHCAGQRTAGAAVRAGFGTNSLYASQELLQWEAAEPGNRLLALDPHRKSSTHTIRPPTAAPTCKQPASRVAARSAPRSCRS